MKKLIQFLTISTILFFNFSRSSQIEPTSLFMGTVQFPENLDNNDLCLYYKGQKLSIDWDKNNFSAQYSFLESKSSQILYILICNDMSYQTEEQNTVQHLQLKKDEQYRCYQIQAMRKYDDENNVTGFSWNISDYKLEQGIIPDNALIFLFNPNLIDGLRVHTWNKKQSIRLMPTISITQSTTSKELVRTMTIARLKAIDIDTIHTKDGNKQVGKSHES